MSPAVAQRSVQDLIAQAVEAAEDPQAHNIAARVVRELGEETLRALAADAVTRSVRSYLRGLNPQPSNGISLGVPRSTRWDLVRRDASSGDLDLARMEVDTGQQTKPLLDCLYMDLTAASDNHLQFAMANEVYAEQYRKLAEALLANDDARTVRDLPAGLIRGILSA